MVNWYFDGAEFLVLGVSYFFILFISIILHEVVHILLMKKYGADPKFSFVFNSIWDFGGIIKGGNSLTDDEYTKVLGFGIGFGMIPILIAGYYFMPSWLLLVPYLFMCRSDLKNMLAGIEE